MSHEDDDDILVMDAPDSYDLAFESVGFALLGCAFHLDSDQAQNHGPCFIVRTRFCLATDFAVVHCKHTKQYSYYKGTSVGGASTQTCHDWW